MDLVVKERDGVIEVTMNRERAEGDEPACGEGFMDEACGYDLRVDLTELEHVFTSLQPG